MPFELAVKIYRRAREFEVLAWDSSVPPVRRGVYNAAALGMRVALELGGYGKGVALEEIPILEEQP